MPDTESRVEGRSSEKILAVSVLATLMLMGLGVSRLADSPPYTTKSEIPPGGGGIFGPLL